MDALDYIGIVWLMVGVAGIILGIIWIKMSWPWSKQEK